MELVINKKTYVLRELNSSRRQFFVNYIFPFYNYSPEGLEKHFQEIQNHLSEKFKIKKSLDQVKKDFFKEFGQSLNLAIWIFLKDEDKKEIGIAQNLNVDKVEIEKLINWVSTKIKAYSEHVSGSKSVNKSEDIEAIYCYLAATYGWTFEQMKEMDELQLLKSIEEAIDINRRNQVDGINSMALATAYGSGSKRAKTEIDKINKKVKTDLQMKEFKKVNPTFEMKNELTREQLQKIMDKENGKKNG